MPSDKVIDDEYFQPEISIFNLTVSIDQEGTSQAPWQDTKIKFARARFGLDFPYERIPNTPYSFQYTTFLLTETIRQRIVRSARDLGLTAYVVDYTEGQGSWESTLKLIIEGIIAYAHLREALERMAKDLEDSLRTPGFTVHVAPPTPHNVASRRITHQQLAVTRQKITTLKWLIGIVPIFLCGIAAIIYFHESMQEEREKEPQKIEITLKPEGALPVSVQEVSPAKDTTKVPHTQNSKKNQPG